MAITTHYSNVPIAPTNVATETIRNENQDKAIIPPTQSVTKAHKERAIDPEKEHDAEQGHQQHSSSQQHQQQKEEPEAETTDSSPIKTLAVNPYQSALKRSDIHIATEETKGSNAEPQKTVASQDVKEVRQQLKKVYQTGEEDSSPSSVSEWL